MPQRDLRLFYKNSAKFIFFGAPTASGVLLVSPNSIKIAPNGLFFGASTGSEVVLCWGRCTKISTFLRAHPTCLKTEIPTLSTKSEIFYRIKDFL